MIMVGHDTFPTVARSFMSNMVLLLPISTSEEQELNVKKTMTRTLDGLLRMA